MTPAAGTDGEIHGRSHIVRNVRPYLRTPPPLRTYDEESREEVVVQEAVEMVSPMVVTGPDTVEAYVVQDKEGERVWYERPFCRAMLVGSLLLALLLVVGVIVLVMYLTNSIGLRAGGAPTTAPTPTDAQDPSIEPTPTSAPTNAPTAEQIA